MILLIPAVIPAEVSTNNSGPGDVVDGNYILPTG